MHRSRNPSTRPSAGLPHHTSSSAVLLTPRLLPGYKIDTCASTLGEISIASLLMSARACRQRLIYADIIRSLPGTPIYSSDNCTVILSSESVLSGILLLRCWKDHHTIVVVVVIITSFLSVNFSDCLSETLRFAAVLVPIALRSVLNAEHDLCLCIAVFIEKLSSVSTQKPSSYSRDGHGLG